MRLVSIIIAGFFLIMMANGCSHQPSYRYYEGEVWHTRFHITYKSLIDLTDSIDDIFYEVEMSLSPFVDSSAISRINRNETMITDTLIRKVFLTSVEINRLSGGSFDPTVAPLVNLWGFGYLETDSSPSLEDVGDALATVGLNDCAIDSNGFMVKKTPETQFNFSAITKGLGCDMIADMLVRNEVDDYIVEIGGEIVMKGVNEQGHRWAVQIDSPVVGDSVALSIPFAVIKPGDCGLATSGNYRNFHRDQSGERIIGHTISPLTGYPVYSSLVSATVIASDCITADALATACMAMSVDSAVAMIEARPESSALFIIYENQSLVPLATSGFPWFR